MRRSARTVAIVVAGMAFLGLSAMAGPSVAGATLIKVNAPGNDPRGVVLETSDLGNRDVDGVQYRLPGNQIRTVTGWSLARVLTVAAGRPEASGWLDASRIPSVSLAPPSTNIGAKISVTSNEILDQGIFGGGRTPVFVEGPNGSIDFIKPGVNGSPGAVYRYSVSVEIRTERVAPDSKRLRVEVSPRAIEQGGRVSFRVTVPGRGASGLSFVWTIREAESGRTVEFASPGGSVSRTIARKGSYTVLVELSGFIPAVGSFTVGSDSGEKKESGKRPGTASMSGTPGTPAPPTVSALSAPPPSSAPSGSGPGLSAAGRAAPGEPAKEKPRNGKAPDGLEQVSGELIGPDVQVIEVPPEEFAGQSAGPSGIDDGPGFLGGMAGEAATLLGVGLLMALGGLLELRVLSRRS